MAIQNYPGFTLEKRDDIYVYTINTITRAAVDAWFETDIAQANEAATTTGHVLRLYHLAKLIFPTPYWRTKLHESHDLTPPNLYESTAVVITNPTVYHTIRTLLQRDLPAHGRNVRGIFQDEASGLHWLDTRRELVAQWLQNDTPPTDESSSRPR